MIPSRWGEKSSSESTGVNRKQNNTEITANLHAAAAVWEDDEDDEDDVAAALEWRPFDVKYEIIVNRRILQLRAQFCVVLCPDLFLFLLRRFEIIRRILKIFLFRFFYQ